MSIENQFENTPVSTDRLEFTVEDLKAVESVHHAVYQSEITPDINEEDVESFKEDIEGGYIFRRGGTAIGYIQTSPAEADDTLYIEEVAVVPNERNAVMTRRIVDTIRELAYEQDKAKIEWFAASKIMKKLTNKIGAESSDSESDLPETFLIPTDALSVETLISMTRNRSRK